MALTPITPLPTPAPTRSMTANEFDVASDAHMVALPGFVSDVNTLATEMDALALDVEADAAAAAASAAAAETAIAESLLSTSATSLAVGTGSKAFTTQAGKLYTAGMWVLAVSDADPTNYMHGYVASYASTTLTVIVTSSGGSGTHADWSLSVSGTRGATGPTGEVTGPGSSTAGNLAIFADGTGNLLADGGPFSIYDPTAI